MNNNRELLIEQSILNKVKNLLTGRVEQLEKKEGERSKERISIISILISGTALAVSIIVNFFKQKG